jgi:GntR family transcriptional regulator, rspAB operon transcriptional repressor
MIGRLKQMSLARPVETGIETKSVDSLKERAYAEIKHRVITCTFKPGEELSESAVANLLKIGRTPVHQAFDRLHIEGLVDVQPRKGIVVRPINLDEVIEIIETRLLNESFAVRLAAERASSTEIMAIRNVLMLADEEVKSGDVEKMMLLDRDFHRLIARAAHNTVLADLLLKLHERSLRLWFISLGAPNHQTSVQAQHDRIYRAISQRDANAAEAAMYAHIESFRQNVLRYL